MAKAQVMWHKMNQIIAKCVKCVCAECVCGKSFSVPKFFLSLNCVLAPVHLLTQRHSLYVFSFVFLFFAHFFSRFFLALAIVESSHKAAEGLSLAGWQTGGRWQVTQREVSSDTIRFVNENEPQHELAICQIDFLSLRFALV